MKATRLYGELGKFVLRSPQGQGGHKGGIPGTGPLGAPPGPSGGRDAGPSRAFQRVGTSGLDLHPEPAATIRSCYLGEGVPPAALLTSLCQTGTLTPAARGHTPGQGTDPSINSRGGGCTGGTGDPVHRRDLLLLSCSLFLGFRPGMTPFSRRSQISKLLGKITRF